MNHKQPDTAYSLHNLLADRWSPRAFDSHRIIEMDKLQSILEAARWAPSCFNDQPWRFIVCNRHTDAAAWEAATRVLTEKNQRWARHAPVIILLCSESLFGHNNNENRWAQYDTGAASMSICLQATALGLCTHQMGGFDIEAAKTAFAIPESVTPMAMLALGYQGRLEDLDPDFVEAEQQQRLRKPLDEIVFEGRWR